MYCEYMTAIAGMFPDYPVNVKPMPCWMVGLARPDVKTLIGKSCTLDVDALTAPGALSPDGFSMRALEVTLKNMCDDVIAMGAVEKPDHNAKGRCRLSTCFESRAPSFERSTAYVQVRDL